MADFEKAVEVVLEHEGGIGNLRGDPGGRTCFGWSATECERLGIAQPQTTEEARALYGQYFWHLLYNQITSQNVATKIMDSCVNQGEPAAINHLQQALRSAGSIVTIDGAFGPASLTAINLTPENLLLPQMRMIQYASYDRWIAKDPDREAMRKDLARRAAWPDPDGSIAQALLAGTYEAKG